MESLDVGTDRIALGTAQGVIDVRDLSTLAPVWRSPRGSRGVNQVFVDWEGQACAYRAGSVRVGAWDMTGRAVSGELMPTSFGFSYALSDGVNRRLFTKELWVEIHDLDTGALIKPMEAWSNFDIFPLARLALANRKEVLSLADLSSLGTLPSYGSTDTLWETCSQGPTPRCLKFGQSTDAETVDLQTRAVTRLPLLEPVTGTIGGIREMRLSANNEYLAAALSLVDDRPEFMNGLALWRLSDGKKMYERRGMAQLSSLGVLDNGTALGSAAWLFKYEADGTESRLWDSAGALKNVAVLGDMTIAHDSTRWGMVVWLSGRDLPLDQMHRTAIGSGGLARVGDRVCTATEDRGVACVRDPERDAWNFAGADDLHESPRLLASYESNLGVIGATGGVTLWSVDDLDGVLVRKFNTSHVNAKGIAVGPERVVAVAGNEGELDVFPVSEDRVRIAAKGATGALAFSPDGKRLAFAAGDDVVFWDVRDRRESARVGVSAPGVAAYWYRGDDLVVADANRVLILDGQSAAIRAAWTPGIGNLTSLGADGDVGAIVVGNATGQYERWCER